MIKRSWSMEKKDKKDAFDLFDSTYHDGFCVRLRWGRLHEKFPHLFISNSR
jgi:hypothetical protein